MELEDRYQIIDTLRGFAAVLVVVGHVIQYSQISDYYKIFEYIYKAIYSFHIPLFALISGYLIEAKSGNGSIVTRIKRRFLLLLPMVVYSVLPFFTENMYVESDSAIMNIRHFVGFTFYGNGFTWYLRDIFKVSILLIIICEYLTKRWMLAALIAVTLVFPSSYGISTFAYIFVFALIGALIKRCDMKKIIDNRKFEAVNCAVFILTLFFYKNDYLIYNGRWGLLGDINCGEILYIDVLRIIIGVCGCWCAYSFVKVLNGNMMRLWKLWEKNTLCAYCLGNLICVYTAYFLAHNNVIFSFLITGVVTILVTYFFIWLFSRTKFTRIVFLGHR